tara:strand:+ start:1037 stop:4528 length:3492 start_codon:yes stop_codon:yes gene_type:complete
MDLIEDIGDDIGGSNKFLQSLLEKSDGEPISFLNHFNSLIARETERSDSAEDPPAYFGFLCATILAWTINPDLQAANFYERLNKIILEASKFVWGSRNLPQDVEDLLNEVSTSNLGQGVNQDHDYKFRQLLEKGFEELQSHTKTTLDKRLGYYNFQRLGNNYVDIPRAQAIVNAKDREGLERYFYEKDFENEAKLSGDEAQSHLEAGALEYLTTATQNKWKKDNNKPVILEIMRSIARYWDGTYKPKIDKDKATTLITKQAREWLVPVVQLDLFNKATIQLRVHFLIGEFPEFESFEEPQVKIEFEGTKKPFEHQYLGWSAPMDLDGWENLFSNPSRITSDYQINFKRNSIYFLEPSSELGGYIPADEVSPGTPYKILVKEVEQEHFLNENRDALEEIHCDPEIEGWKLFDASNGIDDFTYALGIKERPSGTTFELVGGARIAKNKFSKIVPPKLRLIRGLPAGTHVACKHGIGEWVKMEPVPSNDNLYQLPDQDYQHVEFEVFVRNEQGNVLEEHDPIKFKLLPPSMPDENYLVEQRSVRDPALPSISVPKEFLYQEEDFKLEIKGGTRPENSDAIIICHGIDLPTVLASHDLLGLEVRCGTRAMEPVDDDENGKVFQFSIEDKGQTEVVALWHGIEVSRINPGLFEAPKITLEVVGATLVVINQEEVYIPRNENIPPTIEMKIQHLSGRVKVSFDGEKKQQFYFPGTNNIPKLKCPLVGEASIRCRWKGFDLEKKIFKFREFPSCDVEIVEEGSKKWAGSQIYDSRYLPSFAIALDEGIQVGHLKAYLGQQQLEITESFPGYAKYSIPTNIELKKVLRLDSKEIINVSTHSAQQQTGKLQFKLKYMGFLVDLDESINISSSEKPSCKIICNGHTLRHKVYSNISPPWIDYSTSNKQQCLDINKIKLRADDGPLMPAKYFKLASAFQEMSPYEVLERDIFVELFWYDEVITKKKINFILIGKQEIDFLGGTNLVKNGFIYSMDSLPTTIILKKNPPLGSNKKIIFGPLSSTKKGSRIAEIKENTNGQFPISRINFRTNTTYQVQLKQGQVALCSKNLKIVNTDWKKIGYNPGEIALLKEDVAWPACWLIEKTKRTFKAYLSKEFPEKTQKSHVPLENVGEENYGKEDIKAWNKIVLGPKIIIDPKEKKDWQKFHPQNRGQRP